jgi:hypothetical protein
MGPRPASLLTLGLALGAATVLLLW